MKLEKIEKFLLLIANIFYGVYIVFIAIWSNAFREYASKDYLRSKIVRQIREQTKLTMDSANISDKDLNYVVEIMGQLVYLYLAIFIIFFIVILVGQVKIQNHYSYGAILLVLSIALLIFSLGLMFITCLIYFFVAMKIIVQRSKRISKETA